MNPVMNPIMGQAVAFPFGITQFGINSAVQVPVNNLMTSAPIVGTFIQSQNIQGIRDQLNSLRIPLVHQADAVKQFAAALGFTGSIEPNEVESAVEGLNKSIRSDIMTSGIMRHFLNFLSPDEDKRISAINEMRVSGEIAQQVLAGMVMETDNNEQAGDAAAALAAMGSLAADTIIDLLSIENPNVSFYAMWAIDQLGVEAIKPLIRALTDPRPLVRRNAAQALANIGEPAVNRLIGEAAASGKAVSTITWGQKPLKREGMVFHGAARIPVMLSGIIERETRGLFSDSSLEVAETVDALVKKGAGAVGMLIDAIERNFLQTIKNRRKTPTPLLLYATSALIAIGKPSVRPLIDLFDTMQNKYAGVPHSFFDLLIEETLVKIGKKHPEDIVEAALLHPSQTVRDAARKWLSKIGAPAIGRLAEILQS